MAEKPPVVSDNGTGFVKAGYAGQNFPQCIFPAMVGRPLLRFEEDTEQLDGIELKDIMCGHECAKLRSMLEIGYVKCISYFTLCVLFLFGKMLHVAIRSHSLAWR